MRSENDPVGGNEVRSSSNVMQLRVKQQRTASAVSEPTLLRRHATHAEYPLERLCVHRFEPFQLAFARHAQQLFDESGDVELLASHRGLTIRGETEEAIDAALGVLKDSYGLQVRVGPATIRYHKGATLEQPWMSLRVRCPAAHLESVKIDLVVRGATIVSSVLDSNAGEVQACGPLAYLLGYRSALAELTSGAGQYVMRLSHYAPVDDVPPGGDDAA